MKRLLFLIPLFYFTLSKAQFVSAELEVSGLTCSMCSLSTQKSLKTLDFIGEIKPDLNKNIFYIRFLPGKEVDLNAIKTKVKLAGFSVNKLIAIFHFNQVKVSSNSLFSFEGSDYQFIKTPDKTLDGDTKLTLLDKDFLPGKVYKSNPYQLSAPKLGSGGTLNTGKSAKIRNLYHISLS